MGRSLWMNFLRTWKKHAAMQIATLAVLSGTFLVVAISLLLHQNLQNILTQWGEAVQVSVYLKNSITENEKFKVERALSQTKGLESVRFISKDEAAEKFKTQMKSYVPDLLFDDQFGNPLPSSFEVNVASSFGGKGLYSQLEAIATQIGQLAGVEEVSFGQGWVENYSSLVRRFAATSWVLVLILLTGSIFVVGNSIRSSIVQRRDEIEIMELVGATRSFIQAPYIFEGMMMGLMSASVALIGSFLIYNWQSQTITSDLGFWALGSSMSFLNFWRIALILLLGTAFGTLGSAICVRKLSSGWAAANKIEEA